MQQRGTVWAVLVEGLPKNYPIMFGWNPPVVSEEMSFEVSSILALVVILCSGAVRFEQFWLRTSQGTTIYPIVTEEMCLNFFSFFLALEAILCSKAQQFQQSGRGPPKEQSNQLWLKSTQWLQRRCHMKFILFSALGAILCSRAERVEQFW